MTKRGPDPDRARRRTGRADLLWRRHKARAALLACVAYGELAVWAAWQAIGRVRKTVRELRQKGRRKQ